MSRYQITTDFQVCISNHLSLSPITTTKFIAAVLNHATPVRPLHNTRRSEACGEESALQYVHPEGFRAVRQTSSKIEVISTRQ